MKKMKIRTLIAATRRDLRTLGPLKSSDRKRAYAALNRLLEEWGKKPLSIRSDPSTNPPGRTR